MTGQPSVLLAILAFLAAIGPLVIVHELGHYWVARWFGVGAERFSVGFGRSIAQWTDRRGTEWAVGWIPAGGYVRFVGDMDPASMGQRGDLDPAMATRSFHLRPVWQRFLIVLAGPAANFLLAILLIAGFFAVAGAPATPTIIGGVQVGSPADAAGLKPGDRVLAIDDVAVRHFEDIALLVAPHPGEAVRVRVARGGSEQELDIVPTAVTLKGQGSQEAKIGRIGIARASVEFRRPGALELIPEATRYTIRMTRAMVTGLAQIISGRRDVSELGGPVRMAQIAGQAAQLGLFQFVQLVALFSINLGFINLLPVPMLDGGHLAFYAIEAVRRRPLSARAQDWAFRGGLALLLGLLIVTTVNDFAAISLFDRIGRLIG